MAFVGAARDAAILGLASLVRRCAARVAAHVSGSGVLDRGDFEAAGWCAAIHAVDTFDPARGVPLEGYATRVVLGAMFNELRRFDPASERVRRTVRLGVRARFALAQELGREPTIAEIEARVPGFARAVVKARLAPLSLDAPIPPATERREPGHFQAQLASSADVEATLVAHETRTSVRTAIGALDARRRAVIERYFDAEEPTSAIAAALRVSPQRVQQLRTTALAQVRDRLAVGA